MVVNGEIEVENEEREGEKGYFNWKKSTTTKKKERMRKGEEREI